MGDPVLLAVSGPMAAFSVGVAVKAWRDTHRLVIPLVGATVTVAFALLLIPDRTDEWLVWLLLGAALGGMPGAITGWVAHRAGVNLSKRRVSAALISASRFPRTRLSP